MAEVTILLISDCKVLVDQIEGICQAIPDLDFVALSCPDAAFQYGGWKQVALVLIHQADQGAARQVARLVRMIAASRRPIATVILGQTDDVEAATTHLDRGRAVYLDLPLDSTRLTRLIAATALRQLRTDAFALPVYPEAIDLATACLTAKKTDSQCIATILDGATPQIAMLVDQIRRVAPQSATILLGGETGTGKTRLARQIHELSDRRAEPFLTVNCGNLPTGLLAGELFGHVRGAFKGASADHAGTLAEVGRGTLFFDGIDALPLEIQTKLLRIVEDRTFEPIGATRSLPLQARLIAASSRPLDEEVAERRFRSDLYYRLNVVGFQLPPLRERRDAIKLLAHRFLGEFASAERQGFDPIAADALQALQEHDWPGNVRELRNVMARCVAICPDRSIRRADLPQSILVGGSRIKPVSSRPLHPMLAGLLDRSSLAQTQCESEYARITSALEKHGNNRLRAAAELGISRMTLYKKLYKYGIMSHTPDESRPH